MGEMGDSGTGSQVPVGAPWAPVDDPQATTGPPRASTGASVDPGMCFPTALKVFWDQVEECLGSQKERARKVGAAWDFTYLI